MYINRAIEDRVSLMMRSFRAVTITGPRQSGKSTLIKHMYPQYRYVSLENPDTREEAVRDPREFLARYPAGSIIDEVQEAPELLSYLQQTLDESPKKGQYVLSGSKNLSLVTGVSQSLVGRTSIETLLPLSTLEIQSLHKSISLEEIIFSGGYPAIYVENIPAIEFYRNYVRLYLERDVRSLRNVGDLATFQNFMRLVAGRAGQIFNQEDVSNILGIDATTVRDWLGILQASYVIFKVQAHRAQVSRQIAKRPKYYFYDTGLLCYLLGIRSADEMAIHTSWGSIFENFVFVEEQKKQANSGTDQVLEFLRDRHGYEADMVVPKSDGLKLYEIKAAMTYKSALSVGIRKLAELFPDSRPLIIYRGESKRTDGVECINVQDWLLASEK